MLLALAASAVLWARSGAGPSHPDAWDERVVDLVAFVEQERGLEFRHPVHVDFLADETFREEVTERDEPDDDERAQIRAFEAMMRALGLLDGDADILEIGDTISGEGTAGFYRFDDQRIVVRGESLDDATRATLVHELTHALQDQHFDLDDRDATTSGEDAALLAVIEGDAVLVERAWWEAQGEDPSAAEDEGSGDAAGDALDAVPPVFIELVSYPYVLGPELVEAVVAARGPAARDELFRDPPTTEQHIVDPRSYLDGRRAIEVDTPALADDEEAIEDSDGDFGMLSLLVVLAERIEFLEAWDAVQGWAGDAVIGFERAGQVCVRGVVAFDEAEQARRFADVFDAWAEGGPASSRADDRRATFESCDPGAENSRVRAEGHMGGIYGVVVRSALLREFTSTGAPEQVADCIVEGLFSELGGSGLLELDEAVLEDDPAAVERLEAVMLEVFGSC